LRCGKVDPADIAREFVADHESAGIRFSGFTVKYSLIRLKRGMSWDKSGLDDEKTQGNGSAMRVAPVGLLNYRHPERIYEDARLSSIMTHKHPETISGAIAVAFMVARAATGELNTDTIIDEVMELIGPGAVANNLQTAKRLLSADVSTESALEEIGTSGWVVHTVAAAAYCFLKTPNDFERSVIAAVMGGDDADTTGAVTGGISGAYNGVEAIPERWRTKVERGPEIEDLARELWKIVQ
jgi:ADP-ribosylglycohydrolase